VVFIYERSFVRSCAIANSAEKYCIMQKGAFCGVADFQCTGSRNSIDVQLACMIYVPRVDFDQ
jgi:hypothetical protein